MKNNLYPIFLKVEKLNGLVVGGGAVAHEKLFFMLKNSPETNIDLVAIKINPEIRELSEKNPGQINLIERAFQITDLKDKHFILAATNNRAENKKIAAAAKEKSILINVADTPDLCDFYLGSIVTRGDLKVAISTNGKSPTFAKRFREFLESILPEHTEQLIENLHSIRNNLNSSFNDKVKRLNEITIGLLN
jgi:precorrin-2 dehydrogenase/sirohydrochlorin ferrochelatase